MSENTNTTTTSLDQDPEMDENNDESLSIFKRISTTFAPKIKIDEKLIGNEKTIEYALVKYYSAIQITMGLILLGFSFLLIIRSGPLFILVTALSILLLLTGYEIEEVYITDERLLVRRIGLFERIIRIPSDEEHVLKHIVSFTYGRAPFQLFSVLLGSIGIIGTLSNSFGTLLRYILLITALGLFFFGLRLNKRILTLSLAGGHNVLLGTRKGIPKRIITALMRIILKKPEEILGVNDEVIKKSDQSIDNIVLNEPSDSKEDTEPAK